jgi:hypothetical protein
VERAVLAGKALGNDLCVSVDEDGHVRLSAVGDSIRLKRIFSARAQKCLSESKHLAMKNVHDGEVVHPSIDAQQIYVQARTNSIVLADPTTSSSSRT